MAATKVAFAFTGEGSEWVGMGQALYESEPVVRAVLDRCDAVLREERGASLLDVMFGRPVRRELWTTRRGRSQLFTRWSARWWRCGRAWGFGRARWSGRVLGSLRQRRRRGCSA